MICDAQSLPDESDGSGEVPVIGSGPVGLVIARRLAELGVGATVLEVDVDLPDGRDRDCLNVEFSDQVLEGAQLGRTRQLGAGSISGVAGWRDFMRPRWMAHGAPGRSMLTSLPRRSRLPPVFWGHLGPCPRHRILCRT